MMAMAETIFWGSLALLAMTYAGYPLAMLALARLRARPWPGVEPDRAASCSSTTVSVIIPARDEEAVLARKLESVLAQPWPRDRLEVIVVDDGSRDGTDEQVRRFEARGVRLVSLPRAAGKAVAINAGVAASVGEVVVLTDARQPLEPGALPWLVAPLVGATTVGAVSGELALDGGAAARSHDEGLGAYRHMDDALRRAEAASGSAVGVTGALWALRRALFVPLPRGLLLDDLYLSLWVARRGRRVVVAPRARVRDVASPSPAHELRRRIRTLAGNFQLLRVAPWLLSPRDNPLFLRLLGHKLLRLIAPLALVAAAFSNLVLALPADRTPLYLATLAVQVAGYALAAWARPPQKLGGGLGAGAPGPLDRLARLCRSFVFLHVAAGYALWRFLRHEEHLLWRDGTREEAGA